MRIDLSGLDALTAYEITSELELTSDAPVEKYAGQIRDAIYDYTDPDTGDFDADESVFEIADGLVPVYTLARVIEFGHIAAAWRLDSTDNPCADADDLVGVISGALFAVYERALYDVLSEIEITEDDESEGEES